MINRNTKYEDLPEYLSPAEFATYFSIGKTTVYCLLESGDLPSKRLGRRYFIPKIAARQPQSTGAA